MRRRDPDPVKSKTSAQSFAASSNTSQFRATAFLSEKNHYNSFLEPPCFNKKDALECPKSLWKEGIVKNWEGYNWPGRVWNVGAPKIPQRKTNEVLKTAILLSKDHAWNSYCRAASPHKKSVSLIVPEPLTDARYTFPPLRQSIQGIETEAMLLFSHAFTTWRWVRERSKQWLRVARGSERLKQGLSSISSSCYFNYFLLASKKQTKLIVEVRWALWVARFPDHISKPSPTVIGPGLIHSGTFWEKEVCESPWSTDYDP